MDAWWLLRIWARTLEAHAAGWPDERYGGLTMRRIRERGRTWLGRGGSAALVLALLGWLVLGSPSVPAAVLGALSVAVLVFVLAELTGQWPARRAAAAPGNDEGGEPRT